MGRAKWKYVKRQLEKKGISAEVYIDGAHCSQQMVHMEINRQAFETQVQRHCRCEIFSFTRCCLWKKVNTV